MSGGFDVHDPDEPDWYKINDLEDGSSKITEGPSIPLVVAFKSDDYEVTAVKPWT